MKKIVSFLIISTMLLFVGCSLRSASSQSSQNSLPDTNKSTTEKNDVNSADKNNLEEESNNTNSKDQNTGVKNNKNQDSQGSNVKKTTTKIKIYLIAIDDNGKGGKKIDTGDSLIPIERTISTPSSPLVGALTELFSIKDRSYGQSGLYNSLYQSNLKVENAKIVNGVATINISGKLMLGGELDNPRVKAQIVETALQFSTVKDVKVFINGKSIDSVLSLK
ncbi:hypothetical protein CPJCM30710_23990 [Clostridium polyendosporum]|uniref:GerMN domain-containing protein n=1 Tax=Clostridium polyendosporum TaxID=69208 RepID=A0A919VMM5_9CLOT|nr:GerMN domain-containing protein [Clostridium polyendosporum]GIM29733.1 hypothetical protein CPJCM30710_23990 [Clostridium polyendosporum]